MNLRQEAADVLRTIEFTGPDSPDGYPTAPAVLVLDALLDWLDTNAQHIANTIDYTPGVRHGWFNYFHVKALVSVLRDP